MQLFTDKDSWLSGDNLARSLFFIIFLLFPMIVLPFSGLYLESFKYLWLSLGVVAISFFCLIKAYKNKNWRLTKNPIIYGLLAIVGATFLTATLSESPLNALLSFEKDSFFSILFLSTIAFLPLAIYRVKDDLLKFSFLLGLTSFFTALLELVLLLASRFLNWSIFKNYQGLISLSWFDRSLFFGLVVVISLVLFEFFARKKSWRLKVLSLLPLIISMLFLVLTNYLAVWLMLAFCSLALIVFLIRRSGWVEMISLPALILTISIVFVIFSAQTSWLSKGVNYVQQSLRVNIFEVRPNWSSTWAVTRMAIKTDPLTGVGPTRFWRAWDLYKPKGVNDSPYWNTDFNYGIGFIPSMVTTGGLLGLLGWLAFLLATIFVVAKSALVFWQKPDEKNSLLIFSFLPVVYLLSSLIFRIPGLVNLALLFIFLGWLMVAWKETGIDSNEWTTGKDEKKIGFASRLSWLAFICLVLIFIWLMLNLFLLLLSQRSSTLASMGKFDQSVRRLELVNLLSHSDFYERQLVEVKFLQLSNFVNTATSSSKDNQEKFTNYFNGIKTTGEKAVKLDPNNYLNWLVLARPYAFVATLGVTGAENIANSFYQKALALNPHNPGIWLEMGRFSLALKKEDEAKDRIKKALDLKANYLGAHLVLAQIYLNNGSLNLAVKEAEDAVRSSPNDYNAWFLLGYLKYEQGKVEEATQIFSRSIQIQPDFANAKYYVGLSLDRLGQREEALSVFRELLVSNPDNQLLKKIISNLNAGRSALAEPEAPKSTKKDKKK
ncbi:MAG: hypothetical protein A2607_00555 [Candidatus Vogelbacteria bacterium RIFOXYD1_FULL_42_15]|uniref:Uncharacterized protein n=1 Tax=Candidatus Vogelbacteria bacterium RIFOXYD1_FULL_42_15 TaxID=1802437 RepID=A0A1G2QFC0_9BACT|nr:MAG: hypothetical protein A2607_00555 [Candidatus Vogelbacteria bacterium RIFOXYD1_FULL_42_15]